jgi:glucose-1-phosphatase
MKGDIRAVVFDFGNVIINIELERTYKAFSELTFKSPEKIKALFAQNEVFKNYEIGKFNDDEFRDVIRQVCGYPLNDDEINQAWNALLLNIPQNRWEYLDELQHRLPIYLLSNTSNIHIKKCKQLAKNWFGISDFTSIFKKAYLSYEIQMFKPDYNIYQYVIDDLNLKPEQILFFDDNADNIAAALDMGIKAVKIDPPQDFMDIIEHLL